MVQAGMIQDAFGPKLAPAPGSAAGGGGCRPGGGPPANMVSHSSMLPRGAVANGPPDGGAQKQCSRDLGPRGLTRERRKMRVAALPAGPAVIVAESRTRLVPPPPSCLILSPPPFSGGRLGRDSSELDAAAGGLTGIVKTRIYVKNAHPRVFLPHPRIRASPNAQIPTSRLGSNANVISSACGFARAPRRTQMRMLTPLSLVAANQNAHIYIYIHIYIYVYIYMYVCVYI